MKIHTFSFQVDSDSATIVEAVQLAAETVGGKQTQAGAVDATVTVSCGEAPAIADAATGIQVTLDLAQAGTAVGTLVTKLTALNKESVHLAVTGDVPANARLVKRLHDLLTDVCHRCRRPVQGKGKGPRRKSKDGTGKAVDRLFPFVRRARITLAGQERLKRAKGRLHFLMIATDLAPRSADECLEAFADYPIVQVYSAEQMQEFFGIKGLKVAGFAKSDLATSLYRELKVFRINAPERSDTPEDA